MSGTLPGGYLDRLSQLCGIDSPTYDAAGVTACAQLLASWCERAGFTVELLDSENGETLIATLPGTQAGRVLLLGHNDTVFARGAAGERPVRVEGDRALGPGVADMKGGVLVGLAAMELLAADAGGDHPTIDLHIVPDEEGRDVAPSTIGRWMGCTACITLECGRASGAVVSARKASGWFQVTATGRAAHAGTSWREGRSALRALAIEALRIENTLHEARPEMSCVITELKAGIGKNTVAGDGMFWVDVRAETRADIAWALTQIQSFGVHEGVTLRSSTDPGFPPMLRSPSLVDATLGALSAVGALALEEQAGGVSDGCWANSIGIPTIDGLGPIGDEDHTEREWIDLTSVGPRVAVVADLCRRVGQRV